jgi:hypothetical protein
VLEPLGYVLLSKACIPCLDSKEKTKHSRRRIAGRQDDQNSELKGTYTDDHAPNLAHILMLMMLKASQPPPKAFIERACSTPNICHSKELPPK